ncbi:MULTISPECIES: diaminopimelate decarboxylase [Brevibacterium]|uniref:Diaminopimelate decarboxylase n=2 Tax=Brevibacterium casei TaxID=33889 RepID=A0A2H1IJ47_9MICO|nr:diaminopimelate decarboxylase [Brevibacterium casei]NJE67979.1 diaminopimelate decarboxylase [Brevibacterium sp. LS14]MBE4693553.1 diaminopimelate decarboxylase [Brevibacterium casei]MBY3576676.1 diaminopimelate decarboxylase [Brevibacterium casei]MCT1446982.1 diaminopimelate decarboxylase [Brevibacterium casei]MCT1765668.1 diaminopimelate decarboxylase [Brevibacterium casei]
MPAHIAGPLHATPAPVWLPYPDDVNAVMPSLWSDNVAKDSDGVLTVAGHPVTDLAERFGTPTFVFDVDDFVSRAELFRQAYSAAFAPEHGLAGADVFYAGKAFLCTAVARWVHEAGLGLDTCSLGEMMIARAAGVPGASVGLHGNNKSVAELEYALDYGVGRIIVDSLDEIDRLETIAAAKGVVAPVMLRVTVGVEAHTHDFIATAHEDQKFGLSVSAGKASAAAARVVDSAHLRLDGLHSHIGSQIFDISGFQVAAARVLALRAEIMATHGVDLPEVDLGGGFGIRYTSQDTPIPVAEMASELAAVVAKECRGLGTNVPRISIEPGRAIVSPAVFTLYRVGTVKEVVTDEGVRTYVAVDGGMSDNIRTALYDADYSCTLANRNSPAAPVVVRVVGMHCESGDVIVRDEYMGGDVAPGDLVAVPGTGAYCRSLSSNYNHVTRPGVLAVTRDRVEWIVTPETYSQLFASDPGMADPTTDGKNPDPAER